MTYERVLCNKFDFRGRVKCREICRQYLIEANTVRRTTRRAMGDEIHFSSRYDCGTINRRLSWTRQCSFWGGDY